MTAPAPRGLQRLLASLRPPRDAAAPRGLINRIIARLVPRLPGWLLPALGGALVLGVLLIAWAVVT